MSDKCPDKLSYNRTFKVMFFVQKFYRFSLSSLTIVTLFSFLLLILILGVYIWPTGGFSYCNFNDFITKNWFQCNGRDFLYFSNLFILFFKHYYIPLIFLYLKSSQGRDIDNSYPLIPKIINIIFFVGEDSEKWPKNTNF